MKNLRIYYYLLALILLSSCSKDFLDKKPSDNLVVPKTYEELLALLDNQLVMYNGSIGAGELSGDNYYLADNIFNTSAVTQEVRNIYTWQKMTYAGISNVGDWAVAYKRILYANTVLTQIGELKKNEPDLAKVNELEGYAYFFRAFSCYRLNQVYAPVFDESTANNDLGVPIKLSPDINEKIVRKANNETYKQIIADVERALNLISTKFNFSSRNRPSKAAGYALLSKIYLDMRNYPKARLFADSSLLTHSALIDYNTLSTISANPFTNLNDEAILQDFLGGSGVVTSLSLSSGYSIDSNLYKSYSDHDLRKSIFFIKNGSSINIKSSYYGERGRQFSGLATDEVYLIKAECLARANETSLAMEILNKLLESRYKKGFFSPLIASSSEDALTIILEERRKELFFRGVRWSDLRRLNKEGRNIVLRRKVNGEIIELYPNDPKYTLPIPDDVISFNGIPQNIR